MQSYDLENTLSPDAAQSYITDLMEQLMLLAQSAQLTDMANGLDQLLEPYRDFSN